jgi:hypothetical protein
MKLILCTRPGNIGAWILRAWMWSPWSHSAIHDDELGVVYDATLWGGGCKVHLAEDFFSHYTRSESREITVAEARLPAARAWLMAQVGKSYDWTALVGIFSHRNWQDDDKWFCSEHAETFISLFSKPRFRASASRITPQDQEILA